MKFDRELALEAPNSSAVMKNVIILGFVDHADSVPNAQFCYNSYNIKRPQAICKPVGISIYNTTVFPAMDHGPDLADEFSLLTRNYAISYAKVSSSLISLLTTGDI